MGQLNLKAVFTLIEKVSGPMAKVMKSTEGVRNAFGKLSNGVEAMGAKMGSRLKAANKLIDEMGQKSDQSAKKNAWLAKSLGAISGIMSVAAFTGFAKGIWEVNSQFEQYETTLTTVLGSQEKAKAAMNWVGDFAARTPYETGQVTDAFVKMAAYQIDATDGTLEAMGNWAFGMNKSLDQVTEALADAQRGEFERFKELGLIAKKNKDQVTLSFGDMTKTVKNDSKSITQALKEIANAKFAGAMMRASKSAQGIMANLADWWTNFQRRIGEAGVFDHVKEKLAGFLDKLNALNGTKTNEWAQKISAALIRLFDALWNLAEKIDWVKVADGATWIVSNFENLINLGVAAWIASTILGLNGLAGAFGLVGFAAAPLWAIIGVVAILAAGAFLLWRNWGTIGPKWDAFWAGAAKRLDNFVALNKFFWETLKSNFSDGVSKLWNILPPWFQGLIKGTLKLIAPAVGFNAEPVALANAGANQNFNHNLRVQLEGAPIKSVNMTKPEKGTSLNVGYNGKQ